MTTRSDEATGEIRASGSAAVPEHSLAVNAPGEAHAWDVDAALERVAAGNAQDFKERLRELALAYRAEEDQHLSFDEVQALSSTSARDALSAKQAAHVHDCAFCRNLIDTLVGSNEERDTFLQLVRQHERRANPEVIPELLPAWQEMQVTAHAVAALGYGGHRWGRLLAMAAGVAIVGLIGFAVRGYVAPFGNGPLTAQVTKSGSLTSASVSPVDWNKATVDCEAQSNNVPSCNLLTAAAKLTTDGQAHLARPVFVSALQKAGVKEEAVQKIDATLAALPKTQGTKASAVNEPNSNSNPGTTESGSGGEAASERILSSAKVDFAAGRPLQGYEHVASYVAEVADRPDVAQAVRAGFIAPVREAEQHRAAPATGVSTVAQPAK
jgi:hypothetical protein